MSTLLQRARRATAVLITGTDPLAPAAKDEAYELGRKLGYQAGFADGDRRGALLLAGLGSAAAETDTCDADPLGAGVRHPSYDYATDDASDLPPASPADLDSVFAAARALLAGGAR